MKQDTEQEQTVPVLYDHLTNSVEQYSFLSGMSQLYVP
jgi:hypothetical protein